MGPSRADFETVPPEGVDPILPAVRFETCPIRESLGVLGHKWSLLVLRDVAFFHEVRFSEMLRSNPGLTPRVLSRRLAELTREGLVERVRRGDREVVYKLTVKGKDAMPILAAVIQYGIKHHADEVFADGKPRTLAQVFPQVRTGALGAIGTQPLARAARGAR